MTEGFTRLLRQDRIDLEQRARLAERPPRFAPHEAPFWGDPYIATQMLAAHRDPATDAASRRPETIDLTVDSLIEQLDLRPGAHLLDLGCGPGLYCLGFARRGLHVAGIDLSRNSLVYARDAAQQEGLEAQYVVMPRTMLLGIKARAERAWHDRVAGDGSPPTPDLLLAGTSVPS